MNRADFIKFYRENGFICFPIKENQKVADYRYKASKTDPNQEIKPEENYGIIPTEAGKTAIIDFDDKERYRAFCENMVKKGYMITESPHGWHMAIKNYSGKASKTELFDFNVQEKKIIEIQGYDHYCVGTGSVIIGDKEEAGQLLEYKHHGSFKIWDARGMAFEDVIDQLCAQTHTTPPKKSRSNLRNYRDRFKDGIPPTKGTSNDYFFQAALVCNTENIPREIALRKLQDVYEKWEKTEHFSGRPFSNIESKLNEVYDNNLTIHVGRPKGSHDFDRSEVAQTLLDERTFYSDLSNGDIYENLAGFLEKINDNLVREIYQNYPGLEKADYDSILFKLAAGANEMPETNKDLIVFKNGVFNRIDKTLLETEEIADLGFKDYNYLQPFDYNEPKEFIKLMFDNVPKHEHPRVKAALRSVLLNKLDPKISITHGNSGVGKSTGLTILVMILKDYALTLELDQLLEDKFIKAKTKNKRLLVLQDMPSTYKDFASIKALTGEQFRTERGFMQDATSFENKLKIWGTANYLAKIPENEKDAMYKRRLSLIHNIRERPYPEDPDLVDRVVKTEGEKIISWILNLKDEDCQYEDPETVKKEWESLSSPEWDFLVKNFEPDPTIDNSEISLVKIKQLYEDKFQETISIKTLQTALKEMGYVLRFNVVKNIKQIEPKAISPGQKVL